MWAHSLSQQQMKEILFSSLLISSLLFTTSINANGISTGNTAQNITIKDGATLTANVGNTQDSKLTISDNRGKIKDIQDIGSRTNSVNNINAGTKSTITNNVGNNHYNFPATIDKLEVLNSVGTATVAEGATLVNNIGTTAHHHYANFTIHTTVIEKQTDVYLSKGEDLKFIENKEAVENLSLIRRLLEMLISSNGKIDSINIKYASTSAQTTVSAKSDGSQLSLGWPVFLISCMLIIY